MEGKGAWGHWRHRTRLANGTRGRLRSGIAGGCGVDLKGQQEMYGLLRGHLNHLMEGQKLMAAIKPSQLYGYFHNIVYNSRRKRPNINYFVCFHLGCGLFLIVYFVVVVLFIISLLTM